MGRWEPNPRGRLARAAFELFAERGFDQTTGAQIAERAGMHERSFFRLFPDKSEVFFHSLETAQQEAVAAIAAAPETTTPIDAVAAALEHRCAVIQKHPEAALARHNVIAANPDLGERDRTKHAELATAMAEALRARNTPDPTATLAADTAMTVFRITLDNWITAPETHDLPTQFRTNLTELATLLAPRTHPAD